MVGPKKFEVGILLSVLLAVASCGDGDVQGTSVAGSELGLAPVGSDSSFVSDTIPATMAPGERVNVEIEVENTGTVDWSTTTHWGLRAATFNFAFVNDYIDSPTAAGSTSNHRFIITAPTSTATFEANMFSYVPGQVGPVSGGPLSRLVGISNSYTPRLGCTEVSTSFPASVVAGTSTAIDVVVENSGSEDWSANDFCLYARENTDTSNPSLQRWGGAICTRIASAVPAGTQVTIPVRVDVPSNAGTYRFMRQIYDLRGVSNGGIGFFSKDTLCVDETVVVVSGQSPFDSSVDSDTVPSTFAAGDRVPVTIDFENTGSNTWDTDGTIFLLSTNSPSGLWAVTSEPLSTQTATNDVASFSFNVVAPTSTGTYEFRYRLWESGIGYFGDELSQSVTVSSTVTPLFDSTVSADTIPSSMAPSTTEVVTVTLENTGSRDWLGDGSFGLISTNNPVTLWDETYVPLTNDVAPNDSVTFSFTIRAPSTTGLRPFQYRMYRSSFGSFGEETSNDIDVTNTASVAFDSEVVSTSFSTPMVATTAQVFTVEVRNSGTQSWPADGSVVLYSRNSPLTLFGVVSRSLTSSVAPGQTFEFTLNAAAPASPATYTTGWQMFRTGTTGFFGEIATSTTIDVIAAPGCGDSSVSGAETCDDGNVEPGDGCSAACTIEPRVVDLSSTPDSSDRAFTGVQSNRQLSTMRIADLDGDAYDDLLMTDFSDIGEFGVIRNQAGRVYVYNGSVSFFDGSSQSALGSPDIVLWGRDSGDHLGGLLGGVEIDDVTGDGNADIVVGAQRADGTGNLSAEAGEVYVFVGGNALYSGSIFDLASTSTSGPVVGISSVLGEVIVGESTGDYLAVLALGDVTNDGVSDIVVGSTASDSNGTNSGSVYVIAGGSSLATTSTTALSTDPVEAVVRGPAANASLGAAAAVGDVNNDGINDLIVSASSHSSSSRTRNGSVYVIHGPVAGNYDLSVSTDYDSRIDGEANYVRYGSDLAVADVFGSGAEDLIVGARQAVEQTQVGEVHVWTGPVSSGTIDNAVVAAAVEIFGESLDNMGSAVASADFNGDGVGDLIFGVGHSDGVANSLSNCGEAGIEIGGSTLPTRINWVGRTGAPFRIYGENAADRLGYVRRSVAAGDLDGDGRADWCVGARLGGDSAFNGAGQIDCYRSPW